MAAADRSSSRLSQRLKQNRLFRFALSVLTVAALVALLAPLLANHKPLYVQYHGHHLFPALSWQKVYRLEHEGRHEVLIVQTTDWKQLKASRILWPPVPYGPVQSDFRSAGYRPPLYCPEVQTGASSFFFCHWLGTGKRGNDVLAGIIYGMRTSLLVGIGSVALALLLGVLIGAVSGFFGDRQLRISIGRLLVWIIAWVLAWFYVFQADVLRLLWPDGTGVWLRLIGLLVVAALLLFLLHPLTLLPVLKQRVRLPADTLLSRFTEIVLALPLLYLLVMLAAVSKPSLWNVIWIIGLTGWTGIARLVRAEVMRVRELDFIRAARLLGLSPWRILWRHVLPNAWSPVLVSAAFGIGNVILAESALSFLGIGMPAEVPSWGALISSGRENMQAWWLIVFPGLCIVAVVLCFNLVGEALRDAMDPRHAAR
ncbi:MAG: ABC transporter permease [Chitinophagales bacterium]|nr:ABC transporter permease [Chitinophagales bacterium]MDW8394437.1 ABC transporter permease [Chitinophagales bacterium]